MNSLLSVTHLSKRYPSFSLEDVCFSIAPGRVMGLIGKNGAGKSTTLKCLLHMSRPDCGQVFAFGQDYFQNETELKQAIGIVFGGIDFYPLKKLSAITSVVRRFYQNCDQTRYESYLHRFALEENKKFKELSNGMKVKYRWPWPCPIMPNY
ncbi:MAG: ATP-binding cassette domain-containing protein [Christensenellales bacterium]